MLFLMVLFLMVFIFYGFIHKNIILLLYSTIWIEQDQRMIMGRTNQAT